MSYETLLYEPDETDAFAIVTLNRPEKLNAMSRTMIEEIDDVVSRVGRRDSPVKALLLRGAGRSFCAGYAMTELGGPLDGEGWHDFVVEACQGPLLRLWNVPVPVVAAVHGHCLGGAIELAACCDIVLAAEDAEFGEPAIRHVSAPTTLMLPWVIPDKHARHLMFTGDSISGVEAERIHLVNRAVPADTLMDEAIRLTRKLSRVPAPGIKFNKAAINHAQVTAGLISSWWYTVEMAALVHTGEEGMAWMRLSREVDFREFLRIREEPFREPDGADRS